MAAKWLFVCLSAIICKVSVDASIFLRKLDQPSQEITGAASSLHIRQNNIVNLRKSKILDLDKHPSSDTYEASIPDAIESNATSENEATPSVIQKKIEKIIRKLQFFSNITNPFNDIFNVTAIANRSMEGLNVNRTLKVESDGREMGATNSSLGNLESQRAFVEMDSDRMPLSRVLGSLLNLTYKAFGIPIQENQQ